MPKVSVLVPLFNTEESHFRQMIESVLNQTFKDWELLLLDDSSQGNNFEEIVSSYKESRIKYFKNERNFGISYSRNKLISLAQGEYLAVFDHDDICFPDRLNLQVTYMEEHPYIGVLGGWTVNMSTGSIAKYPEANIDIKKRLMTDCPIVHSASMIRKSVLTDNHIRYEDNYSPAEDYMLWIRLISVTMFHNLQIPLIKYRDHQNNTTHRQHDKMRNADLMIKNEVIKLYPYFYTENQRKYWIKLFGIIPLIKVRRKEAKKIYYLFGIIPLLDITY